MAKLGYARISTKEQQLSLQMDALESAGCDRIFIDDGVSGSLASREGLNELLSYAREGDVLVAYRLDRLGRSVKNLLVLMEELEQRGIGFVSVSEMIDASTPMGKLFFVLVAAFSEMERLLILERTADGLAAARARGKLGGRPSKLTDAQRTSIKRLHEAGEMKIQEIADTFGVSRGTVYNALGA